MKHDLQENGVGYKLRPVGLSDAQFIIDVRLDDQDRNRFIHSISPDVALQEQWLKSYFEREGDYYFVVENNITSEPEGLIGIYDCNEGKAEWGRWVTKKGSLATTESLDLLFKIAFNKLKLEELYCRTICENEAVVSIHDSLPQLMRGIRKDFLEINGISHDVVEHYVTPQYYSEKLIAGLEKKSMLIFQRNLRSLIGKLEFHHIGVATNNIEQEFQSYRWLGYSREGASFEDEQQGVRGQFIVAQGQPRLELLENLTDSSVLDVWLKKQIKMYHFAYKVADIEHVIDVLNKNRIRLVSPLKESVYFGKRVSFLMLSPTFLIELIEQ